MSLSLSRIHIRRCLFLFLHHCHENRDEELNNERSSENIDNLIKLIIFKKEFLSLGGMLESSSITEQLIKAVNTLMP